jgi:hypothetical protein
MMMRIESCAFHTCNKPCSIELKKCGGCTCHNMNWSKLESGSTLTKKLEIYEPKSIKSDVVTRQSKRRNGLK